MRSHIIQTLPPARFMIWSVGVAFVLFQFFLQLSSGVVMSALMQEQKLSAFATGLLSSAFYYVYTSLQIPVGILFDLKNTRVLLTLSVLVCTLGCLCFALSHSYIFLIFGRLLTGSGAAFAFVGLSHLLRQYFPLRQFAFMIGLSETLGFLVTMLGIIGLGMLIAHSGWRVFMIAATFAGGIIAVLCWLVIPDNTPAPKNSLPRFTQFCAILRCGKLWINGAFVGLSFMVVTVFAAMWAIPFLQTVLECSAKEASVIDALFFCGAAVSCPLFGYLANYFNRRRPIMLFSCISTALLVFAVLFYSGKSFIYMGSCFFLMGICCGSYMLSYTIANELSPENSLSTCTGFTNTLAMLSSPLFQPLVGYLLDYSADGRAFYTRTDYQYALLIVPIALLIAGGLVFFLPERR